MADVNQIKLPNGVTYNFKDTVSGYTKNNGTVTSVATGTGLTGGTITTSGTISIANHSANYISGGYLNIHPENGPTLIPFMNNDIAYLLKRGGSIIVKYDGTTQTVDLSNCFDASPSYWSINQSITTLTLELTLHRVFAWTNTIYIDFGASAWRAKGVKIEVMNTNYPQDVWKQKYNNTNNSLGHCYVSMSHTPIGADNAGGGFNKIRFTLNPDQSAFRISQIGVYNYGSRGLRETFLPKDGGSLIGNLIPETNNTYNLGSSDYKWANGYFTNINGVSVGSSPKFTDTNNAVTQTATSTNANYEVLFSSTADNTTRTEGARKNNNLTFNPSNGQLTATSLIANGSSGTNGVFVNNGILLKNSTFTNDIAIFSADSNSGGGCLKLYNSAGSGESVAIYSDLNNSGSIWLSRSDASTADKSRVQIGSSNGGAIYLKDDSANATIGITGINGNINCTTINNHAVPSAEFGYTRHTFTSSTTLSYTGKSVTCPTGKRMIVRAYFRYVNNGPQQVLASLQSTTYGNYYSEVLDHKNGGIGGCLNFMLNSGETAYYWAKYAGAGTNYIDESTITFTES